MLKATFIGIDKYADTGVRELSGAVRDAAALWALMLDSMPRASTTLLTDSDATIANIRAAVHQTLSSAADDDTVILTFSGHGTRNHRLRCSDSPRTIFPITPAASELQFSGTGSTVFQWQGSRRCTPRIQSRAKSDMATSGGLRTLRDFIWVPRTASPMFCSYPAGQLKRPSTACCASLLLLLILQCEAWLIDPNNGVNKFSCPFDNFF